MTTNVWVALALPNAPVGGIPFINADNEPDIDVLALFWDSVRQMMFVKNGISMDYTISLVAGDQIINKPLGMVRIAAAGQTVVVTNSLVDTSSLIIPFLLTDDATAKSCVVSARAVGSFTLKLNAAATAEVKIGFLVMPVGLPVAQ